MAGLPDPLPRHCPKCGTSWARVEVKPCDRCGSRGVHGKLPCRHLRKQHGRWVLLRGAYPWTGGREGLYCMGCSHPPR